MDSLLLHLHPAVLRVGATSDHLGTFICTEGEGGIQTGGGGGGGGGSLGGIQNMSSRGPSEKVRFKRISSSLYGCYNARVSGISL